MADDSILTPGCDTPSSDTPTTVAENVYLEIDNYLGEYNTENKRFIVRSNLGVPSKDTVYSKTDVDTLISTKVSTVMKDHLSTDDPHSIIPQVKELITDFVKVDGSTPFTAPQEGVTPVKDSQLTTKKFVESLVKSHTNASDPHKILPEVEDMLAKYATLADVYTKSSLYTLTEINKLLSLYVKTDGTTAITKSLIVADPTINSHAATKRYVDNVLYEHKVDVDPHGFLTILNNRLAAYAKIKDVYDKTQTYSRTQLDNIITLTVNSSIDSQLDNFKETINDEIETVKSDIKDAKYVKLDGSVPFTNPQIGVEATAENELVILSLLKEAIDNVQSNIDSKEVYWKTSGPVEATVGLVEDGTTLNTQLTLQEICDAIFYGKMISITAPETVNIYEKVPVTLCIHGSTGEITIAELYQDGVLIQTFTGEDFKDGCITVDSNEIDKDTKFTFKVTYSNGGQHEESVTVLCSYPVFVGLLPKFKFGSTVTMDYLKELVEDDGTNNKFISVASTIKSVDTHYNFLDVQLKHPFIVVPADYPDLTSMVTKSQLFTIDAFTVLTNVTLVVGKSTLEYKIYIYKQAQAFLDLDVTYNFA